MAAITHFIKQDATVRTASTAAAELTNYTIAFSDLTGAGFAASDDVLILVGVKIWGSSAAGNYSFAVGFGTTFAGRAEDTSSQSIMEPVGTNRGPQYLWLGRRTLVNNENIYFRSQGSTGTASYDDFFCVVIRLDDLSANDFLYAEQTHTGNAPSAYDTAGAGAATPAAGDWVFWTSYRFLSDSVAALMLGAIHDGTADLSEVRYGSGDTNDIHVFGTMAYTASLGSGVTVRARYRVGTAGTHDATDTRIFGLRLDAFEDHAGQQTANTVTHSALDTFSEFAGFGSYGLTTTGPFVVMGLPIHTIGEIAKGPYGRIQIGGADFPVADAGRTPIGDNISTAIIAPVLFGYAASQSSGSLDIDLDAAEDFDISPNYSCTTQVAAAFSLTLAGAAGGVTAEPGAGVLEVAALAPTVSATSSVTPTLAAVAISGLAPTVAASFTATPSASAVELTGLAPIVSVSSTLTPTVGAVEITGLASTVVADAAVVPAVGILELVGFAPTWTASADVSETPAAGSLGITGFAPTVSTSAFTVTVELGAVEWLVQYEPTGSVSVSPQAGALEIVGQAPSVAAFASVTVDANALEITGFAPTVDAAGNVTVEPGAGVLEIDGLAPVAAISSALTPNVAALIITGFVPTVAVGAGVTVEPTTGAIELTGLAAAVAATAAVTPTASALVITGFPPEVLTLADGVFQPGVGSLEVVGVLPTVSTSALVEPTPGAVEITGLEPTVTAGTGATVEPVTGSVELVGFEPAVSRGTTAQPEAGAVEITGQAPATQSSHQLETATGAAVITGFAPSVIAGVGVILTTGTGSLVVVGNAPEFAAHVTEVANTGELVVTGFLAILGGDAVIEVPAGAIEIGGYPPFVVYLPTSSRRKFLVGSQDRFFELEGELRVYPVRSNDRQFLATGRRRVFRVGRRGGSEAA